MIPPARSHRDWVGEWAVNHDKKETHVDIVDTSDARPRGLWSSVRQISNNTNGKTEKKQYDNTKGIVLDVWRGVLLAAPGMASGWGPPVAAMYAWRTFAGYSDHKDVIGCNKINHKDVVAVTK